MQLLNLKIYDSVPLSKRIYYESMTFALKKYLNDQENILILKFQDDSHTWNSKMTIYFSNVSFQRFASLFKSWGNEGSLFVGLLGDRSQVIETRFRILDFQLCPDNNIISTSLA